MSALISSPTPAKGELALNRILPSATAEPGRPLQMADVGEGLRNPLTDDELEAHIRDLGRLSEQAYVQGDPHGARLWSARMVAAIAQRSPAKQAEMTAAIERRIDEMTFAGDWAQELGKRLA